MKLLIACLIVLGAVAIADAQVTQVEIRAGAAQVNVRAQASGQSPIVGTLRTGERAILLATVPYWYRLKLSNGIEGYGAKTWLQVVSVTPPDPRIAELEAALAVAATTQANLQGQLITQRRALTQAQAQFTSFCEMAVKAARTLAPNPGASMATFLWCNNGAGLWVGLFRAGAGDDAAGRVWVGCLTSLPMTHGWCLTPLAGLAPGQYQHRLYAGDPNATSWAPPIIAGQVFTVSP